MKRHHAIAAALLTSAVLLPSHLAAQSPRLSLEQSAALRCSAAFALVADGQARGQVEAQAFPPLGQRGREFFVRASAQLMDETGMSRDQVAMLLAAEAQALRSGDMLHEVMPGCLLLLDVSGL